MRLKTLSQLRLDFIDYSVNNEPMIDDKKILQVAIQAPLRRTFDYLPQPSVDCAQYAIGQRVKVPFGRRTVTGLVTGFLTESTFAIEKLKPVMDCMDAAPLIDERLLQLFEWASRYYCHPIGEVILGSLPKLIRLGKPVLEKATAQQKPAASTSADALCLTEEQQTAVASIINSKGFQTFLLAGITGSGKTEVYMRVIDAVLKEGKQALVLVPEIALTPQTVARFSARFEVPILLLHSGLSDGKRTQAWLWAAKDQACVVIGTRSAVFSPLKNIGVIVIDEAHDPSFKQQSRFRYCARDVAVMRAKLCDVPIILGTATPSLESLHNVLLGKYQLLQLSHRPGKSFLPKMILHDVRKERLQGGLCEFLIAKINHHLSQSNQVLIYLNRRGYAPVLICHHCGWIAKCTRCEARLTAHQSPKRLLCHHCGYQKKWMPVCESCQQSEVMLLGLGTEQLEKSLSELFPGKTILRIDRDNVRTFKALEETLSQVHEQQADILVGTQLLVKGHHFEKVTLVAAIDVDNALFSADFRAVERLAQSLVQVAGRAGRMGQAGEVVIQTHQPDHPHLKNLFLADYVTFAQSLLEERKGMQLPPFSHLAMLRAEAKTQDKAMAFLMHAKQLLQANITPGLEISGPSPATLSKKSGVYRANLLVQSPHRTRLHHALNHLLDRLDNAQKNASVRWVLDIDPMEVD